MARDSKTAQWVAIAGVILAIPGALLAWTQLTGDDDGTGGPAIDTAAIAPGGTLVPDSDTTVPQPATLDVEEAFLSQFEPDQGFLGDLGCDGDVANFATGLGLPQQSLPDGVWYWNGAVAGWLRWDGLIYYPGFNTIWSFCTGRQWDPFLQSWF